MKDAWKWLLGILAVVFAAFKYEQTQANEAKSKLQTADTDKKDAVLAQAQTDLQTKMQDVIAQGEADKAKDKSLADLAKDLSVTKKN